MTNTEKLQGRMREKKFTIKSLASEMGLSATALFNKIHNKREFLVSEVQSLSKALSLDDADIQIIFFADGVELKSTNE